MSSSIAEHIAKSPKRLNGIVVARIATCANPPVPVRATADTVIHAKPFFRFSGCAMTPHESDRSSGGPCPPGPPRPTCTPDGRRPSRTSAHWALQSNSLIRFLQSDRSSPVGKQQQQTRSSAFSHDSAIHPRAAAWPPAPWRGRSPSSSLRASRTSGPRAARRSAWLFGAQAYEPPDPTHYCSPTLRSLGDCASHCLALAGHSREDTDDLGNVFFLRDPIDR